MWIYIYIYMYIHTYVYMTYMCAAFHTGVLYITYMCTTATAMCPHTTIYRSVKNSSWNLLHDYYICVLIYYLYYYILLYMCPHTTIYIYYMRATPHLIIYIYIYIYIYDYIQVSEELISNSLYTAPYSQVDLLVRTSGSLALYYSFYYCISVHRTIFPSRSARAHLRFALPSEGFFKSRRLHMYLNIGTHVYAILSASGATSALTASLRACALVCTSIIGTHVWCIFLCISGS